MRIFSVTVLAQRVEADRVTNIVNIMARSFSEAEKFAEETFPSSEGFTSKKTTAITCLGELENYNETVLLCKEIQSGKLTHWGMLDVEGHVIVYLDPDNLCVFKSHNAHNGREMDLPIELSVGMTRSDVLKKLAVKYIELTSGS